MLPAPVAIFLSYPNQAVNCLSLPIGLAYAAAVENEPGRLLKTYKEHTVMPDGQTLLASRPEFDEALGVVQERLQKGIDALVSAR